MIKTYKYNTVCNNACHTLTDIGGNSVRYNFTHGNTYTGKCPEITLRNQYAQELLERHQLFKSGKVSLVRTTKDDSDSEIKKKTLIREIDSVVSEDQLIAYVNENYDKSFRTVQNALTFASKQRLSFPNYKP